MPFQTKLRARSARQPDLVNVERALRVRCFLRIEEGPNVQTAAPLEDHAVQVATALAATLATRLCHDVAGLLGTMSGLMDMADEDPEARLLAAETAHTLMARVRLLRAAWGGGAGPLDAAAITSLAQGLPGIERLQLDLSGLPGELAEAPARLALCLMLAALPGMPRGGVITMAAAGRGVQVSLSGKSAAWPASLADCALGGALGGAACWSAASSPGGLAVPLACLVAANAGWKVGVSGNTACVLAA